MKASKTLIEILTISIITSSLVAALPAKKADANDERSDGDKITALFVVVVFGAIGGFCVAGIQGIDFFCINIKPLCTCI